MNDFDTLSLSHWHNRPKIPTDDQIKSYLDRMHSEDRTEDERQAKIVLDKLTDVIGVSLSYHLD